MPSHDTFFEHRSARLELESDSSFMGRAYYFTGAAGCECARFLPRQALRLKGSGYCNWLHVYVTLCGGVGGGGEREKERQLFARLCDCGLRH